MNHREPPPSPAGMRGAWPYGLSLCALSVLVPAWAQALPRTCPPGSGPILQQAEALPYLPFAGTRPLRFDAPPVRAVPVALSAPHEPATRPEAVAEEPAIAVTPDPVSVREPASSDVTSSSTSEADPVEPRPSAPNRPTRPPPTILPDSVVPAVRPEDFLPYFQLPGASAQLGDVNVLVPAAPGAPAPAPLPPSSATYRQTP